MANIILYIIAVVAAILFGFGLGKKKGYYEGWNRGNECANKWWESKLPKDVYYSIMMPCVEKLFKAIFSDDEEEK